MAAKKTKQEKIRKLLLESPHGLWVREIARKTGLDKSTVSRHLTAMGNEIEFSWVGRNKVCRLVEKGGE